MALAPQRIRLYANRTSKKIRVDVLTGDTPHLLKPSDLRVEVALFDDDGLTLAGDLADLASLTLTVKENNPRTGAILMSKTVTAFDAGMTLAEWNAGSVTQQHALFEFSAAETNLDLDGETEVTHYLVLSGVSTAAGFDVVFANGRIVVEESGVAGDPAAPPVIGNSGVVNPEGVVVGTVGQTYFNTANETFWVKKTGSGNTGWLQLI
jgi:hypothetical protein